MEIKFIGLFYTEQINTQFFLLKINFLDVLQH